MTLIKDKNKLDNFNAYLLIGFAFFLPLSVAITNFIGLLIFIAWLLRGTFKKDWDELKENKIVLSILIFYMLHILGLAWSEDIQWGLHILKKETKFLLIPIFMLFTRREHIIFYIYAFLAAMSFSVLLSYGVWFEILPEFKHAYVKNPVPFMSHISYNPFLTISIYLLGLIVLFSKSLNLKLKAIAIFVIFAMIVNMFITEGRAGQLMFFAMIILLFFQYFNKQKFKAVLFSVILIPIFFYSSYTSSKVFQDRVNKAIFETNNYKNKKDSSVGLRMTFWLNSYEIIKENIVIGVGIGDFRNEYHKINQKNTPHITVPDHPHNMYILVLVQLGLMGIISLLSIISHSFFVSIVGLD